MTAVQLDYAIIELGFDDYLTKPVSYSALHSVVEALLTQSTYEQTLQQYYAAVATRAAIDAERPPAELADDDRSAELIAEIEAIESELEPVTSGSRTRRLQSHIP